MTWLLLFFGEFLNWSVALLPVAIAVLVRPRLPSAVLAVLAGALLGLIGAKFELIDLYLTSNGWQSIDGLALTVIAMTACGALLWWVIARAIQSVVYRTLITPRR